MPKSVSYIFSKKGKDPYSKEYSIAPFVLKASQVYGNSKS